MNTTSVLVNDRLPVEGSTSNTLAIPHVVLSQDNKARISLRTLDEIICVLRDGARPQCHLLPRGWVLLHKGAATLLKGNLASYHATLVPVKAGWVPIFRDHSQKEWSSRLRNQKLLAQITESPEKANEYRRERKRFEANLLADTKLIQETLRCGGILCQTNSDVLSSAMLARSLLEVLYDVFEDFPKRFSFEEQMSFYQCFLQWDAMEFIIRAKYFTCAPMAYLLKQELPPAPPGMEGKKVFCGCKSINQFFRNVIHAERRIAYVFALGMLQGVKRGANTVSDAFIFDALKDHRDVLSQHPTESRETLQEWFGELLDRLSSSWGRCGYSLETASKKACYEAPLLAGGGYATVAKQLGLQESDTVKTAFGSVPHTHLEFPTPTAHGERMVSAALTHGAITEPIANEILRPAGFEREPLLCTVIPIPEPLKVRTITKCEAMPSFLTRPVQRHLKSVVDGYPQFVLTTRPLDMSDLGWILDREKGDIATAFRSEQERDPTHRVAWVSGDYKGATDRLNLNFTKLIFEKYLSIACKGHSETFQDIYRSVLYEQLLEYPASSGLEPIHQANGQLMGSILSFPVLCLANLLCYHAAVEEYLGHEIDVEMLPVLVNGDDILFRATPDLYAIWQKWVARVGFVLSLGKNYLHHKFLTVNSVGILMQTVDGGIAEPFWNYDHVNHRTVKFVRLPYLNAGLLLGQSKLGLLVGSEDSPIWDVYNKVVHTSNSPQRTHKRFMHHQKNTISVLTKQGNQLFLPRDLGGLGFEPPEGLDYDLTPFQLGYVSWCFAQRSRDVEEDGKGWFKPYQLCLPPSVGLSEAKPRTDMLPGFNARMQVYDVRPFPHYIARVIRVNPSVAFDEEREPNYLVGPSREERLAEDFELHRLPEGLDLSYFKPRIKNYRGINPEALRRFRKWKKTQTGNYMSSDYAKKHVFRRLIDLRSDYPLVHVDHCHGLAFKCPKEEEPKGMCINLYDHIFHPGVRLPTPVVATADPTCETPVPVKSKRKSLPLAGTFEIIREPAVGKVYSPDIQALLQMSLNC